MAHVFTVSQLAREASVNPATVRFYERKRLLPAPVRTPSGYRHYSVDSLQRLRFIKHAQEVGFTLREVQQLLALEGKQRSSAEVCAVTEKKIEAVEEKIRELKRFRKILLNLMNSCNKQGSTKECAVIKHLYA